jgi:thioesterase domain-containing protein/acyl carrier protein
MIGGFYMMEQEELKKRLAKLSPEKHDALMNLLQHKGITDSQLPIIARRQASNKFPLSSAQLWLWFLQQLDPDSPVYNVPVGVRLTGSLNVAALEQSLREIVLRHEILRTSFPSIDGQPVQVISPDVALKLPIIDLQELPETERESEAQRLAIEQFEQPFNLAQGSLWQFQLLRLAEEEHILLLTIHHIIFDGKSLNTFFREFAALYRAFSTSQASPLPELSIQYADFACWQQQWLQSKELESQLAYWQQQLGGSIPALELPIDRARPAVHTYQGSRQSLVFPENLTNDLKILSLQEEVTLFMTLLTGFKTLLYCYTQQEDILLCSPVTGHNRSETEDLIGYFNNILLMRTDLSGNPSFRELIGRVRQTALEAYQNQNVPLQKLVELSNLTRTPLSRGMFALHHITSQPLELPGLSVSFLDIHNRTANFDLSLLVEEKQGTLTAILEYKTALFEKTTITQILENFQTLLESLVANPEQRLLDLPLLREPESYQLENSNSSPDKIQQKPEETFVPPSDDLEIQLTKIWENVLGKKPISVKDNFFEVGGHSLLTVRLLSQIEKAFGKSLPLATLFQAPTVEQLAKILHQSGWSSPWFSLVPIQASGSQPPFFGIHSLGKGQEHYRNIARHLGSDQPIYGLDYWLATQTKDTKELPKTWSVEELAAHYIKEMQILQPEGPYFLAGLSFAGLVAYEMAQQLVTQDQEVALLVLFDTACPALSVKSLDFNSLQIHLRNLSQLEMKEKLAYIMMKVNYKIEHYIKSIKPFFRKVAEKFYLKFKLPMPYALHYSLIVEANQKLGSDYALQVYPGKVTLFRASDQAVRYDQVSDLGWSAMAVGGLEIHEVPGDHLGMFQEPHVQMLAEKLRACIDKDVIPITIAYRPTKY